MDPSPAYRRAQRTEAEWVAGRAAGPLSHQQQQHRRERKDRRPAWKGKPSCGCSLAFDDAAQANLEITAAAHNRVAASSRRVFPTAVKQQDLRSIASGWHSPAFCDGSRAANGSSQSWGRGMVLRKSGSGGFDRPVCAGGVHKLCISSWFAPAGRMLTVPIQSSLLKRNVSCRSPVSPAAPRWRSAFR